MSPELRSRDVLRDRPVASLLSAQLCFTLVFSIQATALGLQVYDITDRELDLGLLGLAEFLPSAVLVLVTGYVADRFDKRRVAAAALILELACSVMLAWYASTDPTAVGPIFALGAGFGVARAFYAPTERSMKPLVCTPATLPRVVALHSITWQIGSIVGPVVAGLLFALSPSAPFIAASISAAAGAVIMAQLPYRNEPVRSTESVSLKTALAGLRVIRGNQILLGAISLDLFAVLFGGAIALLPAIAEQRLGVGAVGVGFLRGAVGGGAALTSLYLVSRPLERRVGSALFVAVAGFGVGTIVLGMTRSYAIALLAVAVLSAADMVSVFIRATLVPMAAPADSLGRVHAVEQVFIGGSNELGAFESGVAAALLGVGPAVVLGGAATLGVVTLWWWIFPALRRVDRFSEVAASPVEVPTRLG